MIKYEILENKNPRGVIQIIHGMGEHLERYYDFSKYLNENGYIVILSNHIGHGKEALKEKKLGIIEGEFGELVKNQMELTRYFEKKFPTLPFYILGHSMGSFIAQGHLKNCGEKSYNYIFMGSCYEKRFLTILGKQIFQLISWFGNKPRKFFNKIIFLGANLKIKDKDKNNFSWLTRDKNEIEKFIKDSACGFTYPPNFYKSFLDYIYKLHKKGNFEKVDKDKNILIISGEDDPIGLYGKGVKNLYSYFKGEGFEKIEMKLYSGGRHEILNEMNRDEVYQFLLDWIEEKNI